MMKEAKDTANIEPEGQRSTKRNLVIPIMVLLAVIVLSIVLFLVYGKDPAVIAQFKKYGYPGAFLVSLIGNASVFFFMGTVLPVMASIGIMMYTDSGIWGPVGVGLAGGAGAAIGEIAGYSIGYSGRGVVEKSKRYERLVARVRSKGMLAVFILSVFPLFFDIVAIAAGALRIPLWKFVLACWLGRTLLYVSVVTLVAMGWGKLLPYFG